MSKKPICRMCNNKKQCKKRKFEKVYCKTNIKEKIEFFICDFCNKNENIFIIPALLQNEEPYIFVSLNYGNF